MTQTKDPQFEELLAFLKHVRGFDFTGYKRPSLQRRVQKRMGEVGIEDYRAYADYLEVHPEEFTALFNTILINVTSFFRNPQAWDALRKGALARILENKSQGELIRVWTAACASGEETYTTAMVLAEALGAEEFLRRVKIYATDMDEQALSEARSGVYTLKHLETVPAELREKYFEHVHTRPTFRGDLRRSIIFGRHNLLQDAAISRLDLLVCRNTLMYFNAEAQARILTRFHFGLVNGGYVFLGKAEMLLGHGGLFVPVDLRHRIFQKVAKVNMRDRLLSLSPPPQEEGRAAPRSDRLHDIAFDAGPEPQIIVDRQGVLTVANEAARNVFGISTRDLGRPLQDMEISYRPVELRSLIERAYAEQAAVSVVHAERPRSDGETQYFDLRVTPLSEPGGRMLGVAVLYQDVTRHRRLQEGMQQTNQELETAYEELHSSNEELETTNEELQSTVEELETTNEELQSANEEMETMNEELQAANHELETINNELRERSDQLDRANAFLGSVLTSLRAGVCVVNRRFEVITWNTRAEDLWGVRPEEAQGKPLLSLDIGLPVQRLRPAVEECLDGKRQEEVVVEATNRKGKQIQCRVTCTPLMDSNAAPQGVILLMEEWGPENGRASGAQTPLAEK